jgi:hypothetical protein
METGVDIGPVLNHLRLAIRNGVILIPTAFVHGLVVAWGISKWPETRLGASFVVALGTVLVVWLTWAYYRTRGLMHHSGFGKTS